LIDYYKVKMKIKVAELLICCTTNQQQIELMEFVLVRATANKERSLTHSSVRSAAEPVRHALRLVNEWVFKQKTLRRAALFLNHVLSSTRNLRRL